MKIKIKYNLTLFGNFHLKDEVLEIQDEQLSPALKALIDYNLIEVITEIEKDENEQNTKQSKNKKDK
jgi:hypothetical protein|nr:MAG TPA: hypothetical protein [Caudoviricetes sp.]